MTTPTIRLCLIVGLVLGGLALRGATAQRPLSAALPPPTAGSRDAALVQQGAALAALGNCASCHTAPTGHDYAGGLAIKTPFGTIFSSNITPDPATGIGHWSGADFIRAMRKGIDPAGRHLYPAFPYDHFTRVTDDDDRALYAYLMTREPAQATPPANQLPFPFNQRLIMAAWNALFLHEGPVPPDPTHDATWNRGAYLVEGLGHCGACHTPHNRFGAERSDAPLAGAPIEGWFAVALNAQSSAPIPWTSEQLAFYLGHGWAAQHGAARGPMAEVTENLAKVPEADIAAIATYITDRMGARAAATPPTAAPTQFAGAAIYATACASCHDSGRPLPFGGLPLAFSSGISAASPANLINLTLNGLPATPGKPGPIMPGFRGVLTDAQVTDLLGFLRARYSDKPAWGNFNDLIRAARQEGS